MPTILVTGSSGKTSSRLAKLLHQSGHSYLIASRKGTAPAPHADKAVKFDWADASTYNNPFAAASDISAVWLVAPETGIDPSALTKFIDLAVERKVKRFVLLSATLVEPGGPFVGKVHEYLIQLGKSKGIEWTVLRPTWFMGMCAVSKRPRPCLLTQDPTENFTEAWHKYTLASEGAIYSATGEGRLPFVSCDDIAAMAYHGLVDQPAHNRDFFVLGPKTVSYDEVCVASSVLLEENAHP